MLERIKILLLLSFVFPQTVLAQVKKEKTSVSLFSGYATLFDMIHTLFTLALGALGVLAILSFIIAFIYYLTAGGDDDRLGEAGQAVRTGIAEMAILIIGLVALYFFQRYFGLAGLA